MILRKQTIWLLTMLAVMVVLSGYYLAKGPNEQVPALGEEPEAEKAETPLFGVEVTTKESAKDPSQETAKTSQPKADGTVSTEVKPDENASGVNETLSDVVSYFQGYKMKREALMQQEIDEQLKIMMSSDATPQAIAEAKAKHEELSNQKSAILALEELLKANGYKDAVVSVQKDSVNVIVQAQKLGSDEVINIIALTKQHLKVPGSNVTVSFKK